MESVLTDNRKKTVLITGCNRGIGKAILEKFARNGYNIIGCVRSVSEAFREYCSKIESDNAVSITLYELDLKNPENISAVMKAIYQQKTPIDVLVNNAGIAHGAFLLMTSMEKMREVFEVNFFAHVQITQYVVKWMLKQGHGSIINISSVAGIDGMEGYSAYGSSKAALNYFTKTLAKELASVEIRVNAIAPGLTKTDMATQMEKKAAESMLGMSAMKRLGKPEEVADLAFYLASDESQFITGQVVRIDGGM
jgi:3-oxoacyl-[acyl-carrier protein] reductase